MAICGFTQSSSVMPTARSIARAGAFWMPSVTSRLRGLMSTWCAWFVLGHAAKLPDPDLPDLIRYGVLRCHLHAGCSTTARARGACTRSRGNARSPWSTSGMCSPCRSGPMLDGTITVDWGGGHVGVFPAAMLTARTELEVVPVELAPLPRIGYVDVDTDDGMRSGSAPCCRRARSSSRTRPTSPAKSSGWPNGSAMPGPPTSARSSTWSRDRIPTTLPTPPPASTCTRIFPTGRTRPTSSSSTLSPTRRPAATRCSPTELPSPKRLRAIDAKAFELLSTTPVPFRFHDDTDDIRYTAPIIGVDADDEPADDPLQQLDPRRRSVRRRALLRRVSVAVANASRPRERADPAARSGRDAVLRQPSDPARSNRVRSAVGPPPPARLLRRPRHGGEPRPATDRLLALG